MRTIAFCPLKLLSLALPSFCIGRRVRSASSTTRDKTPSPSGQPGVRDTAGLFAAASPSPAGSLGGARELLGLRTECALSPLPSPAALSGHWTRGSGRSVLAGGGAWLPYQSQFFSSEINTLAFWFPW